MVKVNQTGGIKVPREKLKEKIKEIFINHLGMENAITKYELLEQVLGQSPNSLRSWQRKFWEKAIISQIRVLRSKKSVGTDDEVWIIKKNGKFFVPISDAEGECYEGSSDYCPY